MRRLHLRRPLPPPLIFPLYITFTIILLHGNNRRIPRLQPLPIHGHERRRHLQTVFCTNDARTDHGIIHRTSASRHTHTYRGSVAGTIDDQIKPRTDRGTDAGTDRIEPRTDGRTDAGIVHRNIPGFRWIGRRWRRQRGQRGQRGRLQRLVGYPQHGQVHAQCGASFVGLFHRRRRQGSIILTKICSAAAAAMSYNTVYEPIFLLLLLLSRGGEILKI